MIKIKKNIKFKFFLKKEKRWINKINNGPVALVHFDAHLDTWDTYFGAPYTHGTPFRRAREENLFLDDASMHVGIRGPLYSRDDLKNDESFGFKIIHCDVLTYLFTIMYVHYYWNWLKFSFLMITLLKWNTFMWI